MFDFYEYNYLSFTYVLVELLNAAKAIVDNMSTNYEITDTGIKISLLEFIKLAFKFQY